MAQHPPPSEVATPVDPQMLSLRLAEIHALEKKVVRLKREVMGAAAGQGGIFQDVVGDLSFLVFTLRGKRLALPAGMVDEVVQMATLTELPVGSHAVLGLLNYHGATIAVIDLAELLGAASARPGPEQVLVLLGFGGTRFAVVADDVVDVVRVSSVAMVVADEILPGAIRASGVVPVAGERVVVVDVGSILLAAELANTAEGA
ncbi:MAG: chemotaxis protein CheW [Deltaproteobacteria bacterium]|nr:chemotaxis protein CheW [Deltaproteobacteria bacterium]